MPDVLEWLRALGLEQYEKLFSENGINIRALPYLTDEDLKDMGVLLGHRRILNAAISGLALEEIAHSAEIKKPEPGVPAIAESRQVTVLFADLCGYTKLTSEVDVEEIHLILSTFFDAADAIIKDHGGSVDKHVGDCVMAIFGAPIAHGNDSYRSVLAAQQIQNIMPKVSAETGYEIQVHIGIASGQVVASGVGMDAHYTVTGESVNLASRLTDIAGTGETFISEGVQISVSESFALEDKGSFTLKGIANPVRAFLLLEGHETAIQNKGSKFVGRNAELQQFSSILKVCAEVGAGQVIYLRGEAGIGKTRLTEEFIKIAGGLGYNCHRALALDFGVGKGQDAIRTLARSLLGLTTNDIKEWATVVEDVCSNGTLDKGQALFLNDLLDLPQSLASRSLIDAMDYAKRSDGKKNTLATLVKRLCRNGPIFVVIEDIHWADQSSLEFLVKIANASVDHPIILTMTSRIEGDPLDQSWRSLISGAALSTIDLRSLRREDAIAFAAGFFDTNSNFAQACIERAAGNPLFLEQLLRSAEEASENQIPGSIQSIVQSRLDSLQETDKRAIQAASVLGQRFSLEALRHLIESTSYSCEGLIEHLLVRPEGDDFLFSHALVKEAVYNSLLKTHRRKIHRAAAEWYGGQEPALKATHLDRAEEAGAPIAYLDAAKMQMKGLNFSSALEMIERGFELAKEADTKCELLLIRGEILRDIGETENSIETYEAALRLANGDMKKCQSWIGIAQGLRVSDKQNPALEMLDKAEEAATRLDSLFESSQIHYLRGNLYFTLGNIEGCLDEHAKSLELARDIGSTEGQALALGGLGDAHYLRGYMETARNQFQTCVDMCKEKGYGRIEVANRHMVGWSRIHLMEFAEACEDATESVRMAAEVNHQRAEILGSKLAGITKLELGHFEEAETHCQNALEISRKLSATNFTIHTLCLLARSQSAMENIAGAVVCLAEAVDLLNEVGMSFIGPSVLAFQAALTEDETDRRNIMAKAEKCLDSGTVSHNHMFFARTAMDTSLSHCEWDQATYYARRLEIFTQNQPLPWANFLIDRARALAAWGRGHKEDDILVELIRLRDTAKQAGMVLALPELENAVSHI